MARIRNAFREKGISCRSINLHCGWADGTGGDGETDEKTRRAIACARALAGDSRSHGGPPSPVVVVPPGPREPEGDASARARRAAERIARWAAWADGEGVRLVLEVPHTRTLAADWDLARKILDEVPSLGALLDTSHLHASAAEGRHAGDRTAATREAVRAWLGRFGDRLAHVHLRDASGKDILRVPGEGAVDFAAVAGALEAAGYRGLYVVEIETPDAAADATGEGLVRAVRRLIGPA